MGRIVEGFWDCKYCGTKGIRGSIRECPDCKRIRDSKAKFYLNPNNINYVPDEEAKNINRNPDWVCKYCGKLNSDDEEICRFCDAPRTTKDLDYFEFQEKLETDQKEEEEPSLNNTSSYGYPSRNYSEPPRSSTYENDYGFSSSQSNSSRTSSFSFPIRAILIALAAILAISGIIYLCIPKEQELHVQELSWEYSIGIERFKTVTENDIYLPTGARLLYITEEIAYYEDVLDHYETRTRQVPKERLVGYEEYVTGYKDLGNGYFEEITSSRPVYETYYETETYQEPIYRQEPVYRNRYFYEIDKWVYERSVNTSGDTKETYWGETNLRHDERVSSETESYYVSGLNTKKEKSQKFSVSFEDWNSMSVDEVYKFKVSFGFAELVK